MKNILILAILATSFSCAQLEDIYNKHKTPDNSAEKTKEQQDEKIKMAIIEKISLPNTINLKIGQTDKQVKEIMMSPSSVSATETETVWHYKLYDGYQEGSLYNKIVPFRIAFKKEKVVKYGVDQDQVERNKAQVIIQKDANFEKSKD